MDSLPHCLLLPIDGAEEALRPVDFLGRLYPDPSCINVIVSYFTPSLPPIYKERAESKALRKKKEEVLAFRRLDARAVLDRARKALLSAGFLEENIQEHIEERGLAVAYQACRLADIKRVDAVVVQRRTSSILEGFLKADPIPALLHHCIVSPIWITSGSIDTSRAAVCLLDEAASIRAADHLGFMLSRTATDIEILHASSSVTFPISSPAFDQNKELITWLLTSEGMQMRPFLAEARLALEKAGVGRRRIGMTILPNKGNTAQDILTHCRANGIGIIALGHSNPSGIMGFLAGSVTRKVLAEVKDMAVWVVQ